MKKLIPVFLFLPLTAAAGGGGITGGATEVTQLLNHAELIAQVGQAVQTTSNTLMTAHSTMQMLRQLPQTVLDDALKGLPVDKVQALADAYVVMSDAVGVYRDAEDVLRKAQYDAERLNISPSELLRHKANAAAMHGGVYKQAYEQEQAKLARLAETSKEVQKQANTVKTIDSNVGGIQFLASQNVQVQATLAELSDSVAKANALAFQEAKLRQDELERVQKREAELMDAIKRKELEAPPVTRLPLPHEFAKGGK